MLWSQKLTWESEKSVRCQMVLSSEALSVCAVHDQEVACNRRITPVNSLKGLLLSELNAATKDHDSVQGKAQGKQPAMEGTSFGEDKVAPP